MSSIFRCIAAALSLSACASIPRVVPDMSSAALPVIKLTGIPLSGAVDTTETQTPDPCPTPGSCAFGVFVTRHSNIQFSGQASDPVSGIKHLSITLKQGDQVISAFEAAYSLDTNGTALTQQGFAGSDGLTGFGVVKPIAFIASDYFTVVTEATNFANRTNRLEVTYTPQDPIQAFIAVKPTQIKFGEVAALTVSGSPQSTMTIAPTVAITPWPMGVSPPVTTTYSLTVKQPFRANQVSFPAAPPLLGAISYPTSKTVSTTLTVIPPPAPTTNPAVLAFNLQLATFGPATINAQWDNILGVGSYGSLLSIQNHSPYVMELIGDGHSSDDCFKGSDATVKLQPTETTTAPQIAQLFGNNTAFPRPIRACAFAGTEPPTVITTVVTYKY